MPVLLRFSELIFTLSILLELLFIFVLGFTLLVLVVVVLMLVA